MLKEIKEQVRKTIDKVDKLIKQEQLEKQNLVIVSSNFQHYSEEKIRASYEAVKNVQVALGVEWPIPEGMELTLSDKDTKWGGIKEFKR